MTRFLVHASAEAQDDRYYNKTLDEMDNLTLVRDRSGRGSRDEDNDDEQEEEQQGDKEEENEEADTRIKKRKSRHSNDHHDDAVPGRDEAEDEANDRPEPPKSDKQKELEDDWGLYRSRSPTGSESTKADEADETDTEDEEDARHDLHEAALEAEEYDYDKYDLNDAKNEKNSGEDGEEDDTQDIEEKADDDGDEAEDEDKRLLPLRTVEGQMMGDAEDEDEYDEDAIFAHLVFYIDTAENARKNGLATSEPDRDVTERYVSPFPL